MATIVLWEDSPKKLIYDRLLDDRAWNVASWPIGHDVIGQGTDRLVTLLEQVAADISAH
jgi:hypothetical protein